ncbi:MAG: hypothetical protein NTZ17_10270 [Phycisphaerae bacterium]|nr:hypothetical protein [Phycisphaerae bacterium]
MKKTALFCLISVVQVSQAFAASEKEAGNADNAIQQSKYLPLSVGNKWVYRKTVPRGAAVVAWEALEIDEKIQFAFGPVEQIRQGTFEEVYVIKDRIVEDGRQRWVIDVGTKETARDGRYSGLMMSVDRVLWGRLPSSEHVVEIGEIMIWEHFAGPFRQQRTLLIEPRQPSVEAHMSRLDGMVIVSNSSKPAAVTVPAGKFEECIEIVTELRLKRRDEKVDIWRTRSYYAPNVGLVKEEQSSPERKPTYTLELTEYKLTTEKDADKKAEQAAPADPDKPAH